MSIDTEKTQETTVVAIQKTRSTKQNTAKKVSVGRAEKKAVAKQKPRVTQKRTITSTVKTVTPTAKKKAYKTKCTIKAVEQALMETKGCKYKAANLLGCSRVTLDTYIKKYPKLQEAHSEMMESQIDEMEEKAISVALTGHVGMLTFMLRNLGKNRGYYEAKPEAVRREVDKAIREIISKLQEGEISASFAALEFTGLGLEVPDSVRLLLQKEILEPPDVTQGGFSPITEQEMMERVNRRKNEVGEQVENLSQREAEIRELKEEMKNTDSFDPNNIMENMEDNGKAT